MTTDHIFHFIVANGWFLGGVYNSSYAQNRLIKISDIPTCKVSIKIITTTFHIILKKMIRFIL